MPCAAPDLSIIVCTRNRAAQLRRTLQRLDGAAVPAGVGVELLVVDNGSRDGTAELVRAQAGKAAFPVVYLFEPRPGKSRALNLALRHARGGLVAFLDDDVEPSPDWLLQVWQEFSADPELGVLAGRVELADPRDLPLMICTDTVRRLVREFVEADGYFGGCCTFRRVVLARTGDFDLRFGPGARFPAAEDADYAYRVWKAGWKMLYAPTVLVFHHHGRRTRAAEDRLSRAYNVGRGAFYAKHMLRGDRFAARLMFWTLRSRWRQVRRGGGLAWASRSSGWLLAGFLRFVGRACWPARALALRGESGPTHGNPHAI